MYLFAKSVSCRSCSFQTPKSAGGTIPVDARLPRGVVESVKHVQEHGSNVQLTAVSPVDTNVPRVRVLGHLAGDLVLLPGIAAAPDGESQGEERHKAGLGADGATDTGDVEGVAENEGAADLTGPVQQVVEGTGAGVEVGAVHIVHLVSVEDVGGEEHGKEQNDPG